MSAVDRLAARLERVERNIRALGTPQLANSSVEEGGAIDVNDNDGSTVMQLGGQYDGSFVASTLVGPVPPTPSAPIVEPAVGALVVRWDGTFTDALVAPMDFARVEVHVSTEAGFEPTGDTLRATIETPRGTEVAVLLPSVLHYIKFVARSLAGKFGEPSLEAAETPAVIEGGGGSTTTFSMNPPGVTENVAGDVWYQKDGNNAIIGQWEGQGGTSWLKTTIGGATLAVDALDGKTITGSTLRTGATGGRAEVKPGAATDGKGEAVIQLHSGAEDVTIPAELVVDGYAVGYDFFPALKISSPQIPSGPSAGERASLLLGAGDGDTISQAWLYADFLGLSAYRYIFGRSNADPLADTGNIHLEIDQANGDSVLKATPPLNNFPSRHVSLEMKPSETKLNVDFASGFDNVLGRVDVGGEVNATVPVLVAGVGTATTLPAGTLAAVRWSNAVDNFGRVPWTKPSAFEWACPETGVYAVTVSIDITATNTGRAFIQINSDGQVYRQPFGYGENIASASYTGRISRDALVKVEAYSTVASTVRITAGNLNQLTIVRLGK